MTKSAINVASRLLVAGERISLLTRTVDFGDLRRLTPLCSEFARTRGLPVDRFYIAEFLARNSADIRGRVLEIGDRQYTLRFGGHRVIDARTRAHWRVPVAKLTDFARSLMCRRRSQVRVSSEALSWPRNDDKAAELTKLIAKVFPLCFLLD